MNCRICHASLQDYAEGGLAPEATPGIESHLAGCPSCRMELALLRRIESFLASRPRRTPPEDFTRRMLAALPARPMAVSFRTQALTLAGYLISALGLVIGYQKFGPSFARVYTGWEDRVSTLSLVLGFQTPETAGDPGWSDLLLQWVRDRGEDTVAYLAGWREQVHSIYTANPVAVQASIACLLLIWAVYDYRRQRAKA